MDRISKQQVETSERFFRIPKALFYDSKYKEMMLESKNAYALIKDRFELSLQNGWVDKNGDVFLIFKNQDLQELLQVGEKKVIAIKKELNKFDLLEEERQGLNKPNRLYIGNIATSQISEKPQNGVIYRANPLGDKELSKRQFRNCQNDRSRTVKSTGQELSNRQSNDTERNETKKSDTEIKKSFEDDDLNNNNQITSQNDKDSFGLIAQNISQHPELRDLFLEITSEILSNDPKTALSILETLILEQDKLDDALLAGNQNLLNQRTIDGEGSNLRLLANATKSQLEYMADHLSKPERFSQYFAKGLADRLKTLLITASLTTF